MTKKIIYTRALSALCALVLPFIPSQAFAQEEKPRQLIFVTENNASNDGYQYAAESQKRVMAVMLFGVADDQTHDRTNIPHYTADLPQFIDKHLKSAKSGFLNRFENEDLDVYAGDDSFFSKDINRGIDTDTAKLAGLAMGFGRWTLGGGYTWDEKNPAFLDENDEGLILGASYQKDAWAFQGSFLSTGSGLNVVGGDDNYNSYILGISYARTDEIGYTGTVQFQQYNGDNAIIDDNEVRVTIGTRIKF